MGRNNNAIDGEFIIRNNDISELSDQWENLFGQVPFFLSSPMTMRRTKAYTLFEDQEPNLEERPFEIVTGSFSEPESEPE